jgi:hypothetical protein
MTPLPSFAPALAALLSAAGLTTPAAAAPLVAAPLPAFALPGFFAWSRIMAGIVRNELRPRNQEPG